MKHQQESAGYSLAGLRGTPNFPVSSLINHCKHGLVQSTTNLPILVYSLHNMSMPEHNKNSDQVYGFQS